MNQLLRIGVIGDFNPNLLSHLATNDALAHAAGALSVSVDALWLSTELLAKEHGTARIEQCDALWCAPGSPYNSMEGALRAVRFAREKGWPFLGT